MTPVRRIVLVILCCAATSLAAAERDALTGAWEGRSVCTNVRPACRDEIALYRITPADEPDVVNMSMAKVVDGKEEVMGVLRFHVDSDRRQLSSEFERNGLHGVWTFSWSGRRMTGTLKLLPGGEVVRNIDLKKSGAAR